MDRQSKEGFEQLGVLRAQKDLSEEETSELRPERTEGRWGRAGAEAWRWHDLVYLKRGRRPAQEREGPG